MRRVFRQISKFSTSNDNIKEKEASSLTAAEQQYSQTPLHLRPYDKAKYEVPSHKIKKNSGIST